MVNIYIQGQLLDQYDDEAIELTSSVLDVGDLTKNTGDFSKTFTIPASPNNNKHFKHWYNASIDNGFDARTKVEGHIDIDGVPFKTGKWRLTEAIFKDGVIDGYVINFFGNLPNIKDTLGDDMLSDINFVHHDHDWTGDVVKEGLVDGLTSTTGGQREVVYTPISTTRYFYDSNNLSSPDIGDSVNIASKGTGTGIKWSDLRPSIKAKTIVDSIQHKYGTGTRQSVSLTITQVPTFSGLTKLTLNGIQYPLGTISGTATDIASFMATVVTAIDGYTATSVGGIVNILSDTMQPELTPVFDAYEATGMEVNLRVINVGAYPYENPIVFSDDFFQTSEFEQMYLWLKRDDDEDIGGSTQIVNFDGGSETYVDRDTDEVVFTLAGGALNTGDTMQTIFSMADVVGFGNIPYTVILRGTRTDSDGTIVEFEQEVVAPVGADGNVNDVSVGRNWSKPLLVASSVFRISYYIKTNTNFQYTASLQQIFNGGSPVFSSASAKEKASRVVVSEMMPEIKVVDFLKGLFDMFKLVIIPQDDGSMYVNTLDSFYSQGNRYDISDKVDYNTFKVKRGELYQSIGFKFEDPSTILNTEFKNRARDKQSYGSTLVNIYESLRPIKLIDGEKVDIKLPFEQVIYERLTDINSTSLDVLTTISTASIIDKDFKPVTPKPILHYISEQAINNNQVKFLSSNNITETLSSSMLMPMNQLGTQDAIYSLLFEAEFSCWDGAELTNNLYSIHHKDYLESVFELKRRTFNYDALLPTQLITRLGLNDILTIEGIDYRINKFKHNLLTGITKLDLINGFDTTLNEGIFIPSLVRPNAFINTLYFNVPKAYSGYTQQKIDVGDGTSWLTIGTKNAAKDNMMLIRCNSDNNTGYRRSMIVRYTNIETGIVTDITITQNAK